MFFTGNHSGRAFLTKNIADFVHETIEDDILLVYFVEIANKRNHLRLVLLLRQGV